MNSLWNKFQKTAHKPVEINSAVDTSFLDIIHHLPGNFKLAFTKVAVAMGHTPEDIIDMLKGLNRE